ncbi:MAG: glycosyltransferase family 39 protein [Caldilineales bacterium]|nr:glycosyltransferase family 39 protein [Caldilineales bacterium]
MNKIKPYLPPVIVVVTALVIRVIYSGFPRTIWGDEPFYLWLGRNWFRGDGYRLTFTDHWDYHHTPGYPLITAILDLLTGDLARASEWSYILFGALLALAIYGLAARIYGWRTGLAAGLIVALAPATALMPLFWGTMTEPPYLALAFTGIYFAHRTYTRFRWLDIVLAAVFLALSYYVRPESIVFLGAMGLILGLKAISSPPRLRRLAYPALLGLVFILILFPYLLRVRQATGTWTVSQKVGAHFATASGLATGRFQQFDLETWGLDSTGDNVRFFSTETADASALAFIMADPIGYVKVIYGNTLKLLELLISPRLLPAFALPFIGLGLFARAWNRRRAWDELFLVATMLTGLSFVFFFVQERYIVPLLPALFIWFGHGLMAAGGWLADTVISLRQKTGQAEIDNPRQNRALLWLPLTLLALFMLGYTPRQVTAATNPGSTRPAHDLASAQLRGIVQPDDIVMSRYVSIPFEAGAEWIPTPAADLDAVMRYARLHGADYWAIDAIEAEVLRPQFAPLIDDAAHPPAGLEFVAEVDDGAGPVVVYRILSD